MAVATDPLPLEIDAPVEAAAPADADEHVTRANLDGCSDLGESGAALLDRLACHLPLLADLTHADVVLFARAGTEAMVVAEAQPIPVPSLYQQPLGHRRVTRDEAPSVYRVLFDGHGRNMVHGTVVRGAPVLAEVFPVRDEHGTVVGALRSEMLMVEHERQRKRDGIFRRAVARARELILAGHMQGGERLGRLGVHDGVMVISQGGRIEYVSAPAEYLYRRLGYGDNLVKTQLQELETNEYVCFKAMERGVCLEQRVQEQDLTWIKRVIPLAPARTRLGGLLSRRDQHQYGTLVAIEDVTEEMRKEQELRIKTAMIQEIHHRVKNNLQTIAALLRLQARRTDMPEVRDQLRESIGRIISIAVVHEFLSREEDSHINIHEVSSRILDEIRSGVLGPQQPIALCLEGSRRFTLPAQQATSCALIVNELIQNAVEHAFSDQADAKIMVRLAERDDSLCVEIEDNGRGLPPDFDAENQGGLGLHIVRTLVREDLKGDFELVNGSRGTRATISFPAWIARAD